MARKSKYTEDRVKAILTALEAGMGRVGAAQYGGITFETLSQWMSHKSEFSEAVIEAESKCELWMVGNIKKAAADDWRAAIAWLERRRPQEWGRRYEEFDMAAIVAQICREMGLGDTETAAAVAEAQREIAESRRQR